MNRNPPREIRLPSRHADTTNSEDDNICLQNSYKRRPRTALYFHICINSHWLDSNFICGSWMFFLMLINVHHLKFQCMHFEHWYLEPCIYMHNIRVKKNPSISSVMCKPNMENSYCMHIHIYKYRKIITWYTEFEWMNDQSSCVLFRSLPSQNDCYCNVMYPGKKREHGQWIILNPYPLLSFNRSD